MFINYIEGFEKFHNTKVLYVNVNQVTFDFMQSCVVYNLKQADFDGFFEGYNLRIDQSIDNGNFGIVTEDD